MIQSARRRIARALATDEPNQANVIWVDEQPTADDMEPEYVYEWVDSNDQLNIGGVDESTGEKLSLTLNVSVDSGDTGLIGGLL